MKISNKVKQPPKKAATKKELISMLLEVNSHNAEFCSVFTYERLNRGFTIDMLNYLLEDTSNV
tara:strand:+ start:50 stop:238 length:189 start_codon:yes stop_codon:yes gene_type:complete